MNFHDNFINTQRRIFDILNDSFDFFTFNYVFLIYLSSRFLSYKSCILIVDNSGLKLFPI